MYTLFFASGVLGGIALMAFAPGLPWSSTIAPKGALTAAALDLAAQRSMASATWWMVVISGGSAFVGGLGLYLIARTLMETRKAADATLLTAKASEIAVRPFLLVEFAHIVMEKGNLKVSFQVRNSGASPAYQVAFRTTLIVSAHYGDKSVKNSIIKSRSDIAASVKRPASATFDKFAAAEVSDEMGMFLAGLEITLIYRDIFGRKHTETSKYGRNLNYFDLDQKLSLYRDVGDGIGWGD